MKKQTLSHVADAATNLSTKRPWRIDSSKPTSHYPLRILGDGEIAGICYRGDLAQGTYEANARLIVLAVNHFEEMRETLARVMRRHIYPDCGCAVCDDARSLLAKTKEG